MDDTENRLLDEAMGWLLALRDFPEDLQRRADHAQWLKADQRHAAAWERAERIWALAGQSPLQLPPPPPPPAVAPAPVKAGQGRYWLAGSLAVAALVLLTVITPSLWLSWQADYRSSRAEVREVRLEDGSLMAVGADTAIRVAMSGEQREIHLLKGQLFLDVAADQRPLSVVVDGVRIRDVGTAFDVSLAGRHLSVAVADGEVEVTAPGQPAQSLRPGQRLRLDMHDHQAEREDVLPALVAPWRHGRLLVDNQRIGDVVEQLRPYARGMIVLRDVALAERRITGSYSLRDPAAALRAMVEPYQGRVVEVSPWLLLVYA